MTVYTCSCLNVRIFAEAAETSQNDALQNCPLAPECEMVELVDQGFQFSHKCLVHRIRDGEWTVYVCVPCHKRTHAVNHGARLMVVSTALKKGDEAVQALKNSPDFSSVFNMILCSNGGGQKDEGDIQPQSYETLQKQLGELQSVLSGYLKQEEDAMERRIRNYEEEQRNKFVKLKEKAMAEKTKLISILFHNSEGNHTLSTSDKISTRGHVPLVHSKSVNEYNREVTNYHERKNRHWSMRDTSPDVFAMDGLDIDEEDEEADEDALSNTSERGPGSVNRDSLNVQQFGRTQAQDLDTAEESGIDNTDGQLMSTSVPISMPNFGRNLRSKAHVSENFEEAAEFDDIPRHMQALSESIQERDRYIFGDRPRQRVHTGDFTQVKWH